MFAEFFATFLMYTDYMLMRGSTYQNKPTFIHKNINYIILVKQIYCGEFIKMTGRESSKIHQQYQKINKHALFEMLLM